jgi:MerR family transcriptional regulator, light-induced transcriptional regulator
VDDLFAHQTVPEYNTRAVEHMTGVPSDTFRAWERRHKLPAPARTPGNHRLYSERDIAIIIWLKKMTEQGVSISRAVSMARRRLEAVSTTPAAAPVTTAPSPSSNGNGLQSMEEYLLDAFHGFDARRANQILEEALTIYDVETVSLEVMQPALIRLGLMWEQGATCMAVEHFATSFCMRKLSGLFNASQPELGSHTIVMSGVAGEMHELGLLISAVIFSRSGYRVIYLGANLPAEELVAAVLSIRSDAVVLSAPTAPATGTLRSTIVSLRALEPTHQPPLIGYGGAVFEQQPELQGTVDAIYLGKDARSARQRLQQALLARNLEIAHARS